MFFLSYNGIEVSRMKQDHKEHYLVVKDQRVVKSNDLIQKSRFDLSLQEQKIILYLISQITPYDEEFKLYEFSITDFCKICGIDHTSGGNYADLKNAIKEISDKSIWISIDHDQETLLRWIEKPYLNKRSGTIKIRLDEDMKPYLLQLKKNFTTYELIFTLRFRSKYSIRLYELISSIHYHTLESYTRKYTIDELRQLMGIEHVGLGTDFDGDGGVKGIANASEILNFTRHLLSRRYNAQDIQLIMGGNFMRVMAEIQKK